MSVNFANREVCNLYVLDYKTKKPVLYVDYANTNTTELTGENVYAHGGWGHVKRVGFSGEKGGTFSFETQLQSFQLYAMMMGGDVSKASKYIKREVITAEADGSLTISGELPIIVGTVNVFAAADDCGTPLEITVAEKTITATDVKAGEKYVVYYQFTRESGVESLNIKSTTFPKEVIIYADTYNKAEDGSILPYEMIVHKGLPVPNVTLSNSNTGDPVSITVQFEMLADENDDFITLNLIEE